MTPRRLPFLLLVLLALPWQPRGLAAEPPALTSAAAVRRLAPAEAAEARAVRLRGTVLLVTVQRNAVVVLDGGEGIYVGLNRPAADVFQVGDEVEVSGVTDAGDFAPIVRARQVSRVGAGTIPPPRRTTIAEISGGGFDAAWVELQGIVRSCGPTPREPGPDRWSVTFAQGASKMEVQINGRVTPAELIDAEVRLRAAVFNVHNANRQFVRASLQVANASMIEVVAAPPADPFALPSRLLGEVLRFSPEGFSGHRVHTKGIVAGHKDRHTLWLSEEGRGMQVESAQEGNLAPGDVVEVVGFPEHGSYTPRLTDAIFRKVASGPPPAAQPLQRPEDIAQRDSSLVQIDAELREARNTAEGRVLVLAWQGLDVHARLLHAPDSPAPAGWEPGALVRVTGICQAGQANFSRPTGLWLADDLQLWLRSPTDVVIVKPAPWLTTRRALWLASAAAAGALLALVALALNARRQIAQREEARRLAEAEFAAMLAERNRLARELHDTLAQELNAVSMQLELAKNSARTGVAEAALPFVAAAHGMVRQCLAEARESIWDMRSHILEQHDLAGALRTVAEQLRGGLACEITSTVQGRPRRLAPAIENHLLRIGQEAVANALKHARPTRIEIELDFEATAVRLVVANDGQGFAAAAQPDDPGRHFGLRGMRERVAQMHGTLHVGRDERGGTRVEVRIDTPAAA